MSEEQMKARCDRLWQGVCNSLGTQHYKHAVARFNDAHQKWFNYITKELP